MCNEHNLRYKYQFNVWVVEDENDNRGMALEVGDDVSRVFNLVLGLMVIQSPFLKNLPRVDLSENQAAYETFQAWFRLFAGNLLEYQENRANGERLDSPLIEFEGITYDQEETGKRNNYLINIQYT
jgi:hypothetical protein